MKQVIDQYVSYNNWANKKMIERIRTLPEEMIKRHVISSFGSLYLTLLHIWNADSTWWQRVKLSETIRLPGNETTPFEEIATGLLAQSKQWEEWVLKSTTASLEHVFAYRNSKKEQFKQPVIEVILHICNHATYHRGQLVTILRQLGIENIPGTDFINWSRNKKA